VRAFLRRRPRHQAGFVLERAGRRLRPALDLCDLAGSAEKQPKGIEGGSIKPVLLNGGRGVVRRPRVGLHFYRRLDSVLIRDGHKLRRTHRTKEIELYDLAEVLSETTNLAAAKPRLAKRMQAGLEDWTKEIDATTPSPLDRRAKRRP